MMVNNDIASAQSIAAITEKTEVRLVPQSKLFGMEFSNLSYDELCDFIDERIASGKPGHVFTPNVDHVVKFQSNPVLAEAYRSATLRLVDGTPLFWACQWLGQPVKEKLSGSDLVPALSEFAANKGYSVFFLGAAPGVADTAAKKLREKFPALNVAGTYCPPMGFEKVETENTKAVEAVRAASPDFLFVALGSPRQEIWIAKNSQALGVPVTMGIGATLDFIAERVRRAPRWMQRAGLEWVWRLSQEPRRLWRRYLVEDTAFLGLVIRERRRRKLSSNG